MALHRNHSAEYLHWKNAETKIIDGIPIRFRDVCVHEIRMNDSEDPDIMVAAPIWEWQQSEVGVWIMKNAEGEPYWTRTMDHAHWFHVYRIMARLSEHNETFWRLKWGGLKK